jgi:hypothetical protein
MTSNRPTQTQLPLDFLKEAEGPPPAPEPQRGQSDSADVKKTPLSLVSESLMEQIVEPQNRERAWKKVKANGGTPGPDGVTLKVFAQTFRFGLVPIKSYFSELDKWVRRRLRCGYGKQGRNPRTRIKHLRRLGIREHEAVTQGVSSKGPWVLSASQAVHEALSVDYLAESGLVRRFDLWSTLAPWKRSA